jgi:geranylgeranyl diphosphate synthase, type I
MKIASADFSLVDRNIIDLQLFQGLLPKVRCYIQQYTPSDWPEFRTILSPVTDEPLSALAILPLASCAAVGGNPEDAIPVSAAWVVLGLAMRILDDLQDQDRSDALWARIGLARSFNFSAALYALCSDLLAQAAWPPELYRVINQHFTQAGLRLLSGQDRDLCGLTLTLQDYWQTIEDKNASAFVLACTAGAVCGTNDPKLIDACRLFGYHLGLALQLFDDFEGIWGQSGLGDLAIGKITLPVIYGLSINHPNQDELRSLVNNHNLAAEANRVREILDQIHTRDLIIWAALKEREEAIKSLSPCSSQAGVTALIAYITTLFTHIDEVLLV